MSQTQRLDASQLQVLEIVTLPTEELSERIKTEAGKNPVLNITEGEKSYEEFSSRVPSYSSRPSDEANGRDYGDDEENDWFEKVVTEKESLTEHLEKQLGCIPLSEEGKKAAEIIISSLDSHGFTGPSPEDLLPSFLKPYAKEAVDAIQTMDPTGVGAKDWRGAVMLQIKEIEKNQDEVSRYRDIIYHGLDYIKENKLDALARALRIGRADLDAMLGVLKTLTPFPGLKYSSDYTHYALPELSFRVEGETIHMKVLKGNIPSVEIDQSYLEMRDELKKSKNEKDKNAAKYLGENISSAQSLVKMLSFRYSSLEKIGLVLAEKQRDFFLHGPMFLKGLTMTETASIMGVNVSTVSKMAAAKFVDTPWGIYPLRFFFSSEVKKDDGEDLSKNSVQLMIQKILEENNTGKPLSDQKIADALEEKGVKIARRTVAKYRAQMSLESSRGR
ncbi:MAG: RNA polymerase factor sigma-54 [Candidatus Ornithospirochaeta sp.]